MLATIETQDISNYFVNEIKDNLLALLSTTEGSVPLDRSYGIDVDLVDDPSVVAQALLQQEIIEKVEKYEPRVLVKSVEIIIEGSSLKAKILIERNPDYEETASSETDSEEDEDLYYDDIDYDAFESEVFD